MAVTPVKEMSSCWSCLVVIEQGAQVCPLCGADQTNKPQVVESNPAARALPSILREWRAVLLVLVAGLAGIALIIIYNFSGRSPSPADQSAEIVASSLRDIRESLSSAALSGSTYPERLDSLGVRVAPSLEKALAAGYHLQYIRKPSPAGAEAFVIQAVPDKAGHLNLYIDETGIVRATSENRPALAQDAAWWR